MLVGIIVGIAFGVTFEKFARARRDAKAARRFASAATWTFRLHHVPRMAAVGFVCACAGIAAFRVMGFGG